MDRYSSFNTIMPCRGLFVAVMSAVAVCQGKTRIIYCLCLTADKINKVREWGKTNLVVFFIVRTKSEPLLNNGINAPWCIKVSKPRYIPSNSMRRSPSSLSLTFSLIVR